MAARTLTALVVVVLAQVAACTAEPHGMGWGVDFHSEELRARATLVEAQVRKGGCEGPTLFATRVSAAEAGDNPSELAPGRYGFYARARDTNCVWFASGCSEAKLPSDTVLTVVLQEVPGVNRDPSCVPGEPSEGAITEDGATPTLPGDRDASTPDENETPPDSGVVSPPVPDGGEDPVGGECTGLTPDVVACYDFDGSLDDRSKGKNHGQGSNAKFENLGDDRALRVGGRVVSVNDDEALDLQAMTLEVWVRVDSLLNYAKEQDEMTILLDKDQQYLVGFGRHGAPTFQLYRANGDSNTVTGYDNTLVEGSLAYLAFTYDGDTATIYVDGMQVTSRSVSVTLGTGSGTMHIGTGSPKATRPFDGLIDALRISNTARSHAEICATAGKTLNAGSCD